MRGGLLPHDLARRLVIAQTEETRVPQPAVAGPLGEAHLRHQLRLDPGRAAHAGDLVVAREWSRVALQLAHPLAQLAQRLAVESGAHLARVDEVAVTVVAEQQRAELLARAARRGEPADHELLPVLALELEPVARARGHVRAVRALGDQPLPALAAGLLVELDPVAVAVRGEPDRVGEAERAAQQALAREQGQAADVTPLEPDDVEYVVEDASVAAARVGELREARLAAAERDHL